MVTNIIVSVISALVALITIVASYWFAKKREREAEWRKEKLAHYKAFFSALARSVSKNATRDEKEQYAISFNTVGLFASQTVIKCLYDYQNLTRLSYDSINQEEHDRLLTNLVLEVRKDLKLEPKDDDRTFVFKLISVEKNT